MAQTANSILINAPYDVVFDISNDIERWTELFGGEYTEAKVLKREGNKITFQLTNNEGATWQSFRILNKEYRYAYAQKMEPAFPFKYMKLVWLYTETPEGVLMTWLQFFTMADGAKVDDAKAEELINKHSVDNMKIFKEVIEKGAQEVRRG